MRSDPSHVAAEDEWLDRLQRAVEAGYYRTEAATEEQTPFPWQNRSCGDCPFWAANTCTVRRARREATDQTCRYFDRCNHADAESILRYHRLAAAPWALGDEAA